MRHVIRIDPKVGALHEDTIELDEEGLAAWQAAEDARLEMCRAKGWKANRRKPPKPRLDVYLGPPKKQVQRPGGRRAGVPGRGPPRVMRRASDLCGRGRFRTADILLVRQALYP